MEATNELHTTLLTLFGKLNGGAEDATAQNDNDATEARTATIPLDYSRSGANLEQHCRPEQLRTAAELLDNQHFLLESITGVDWPEKNQFEVLYDFIHYAAPQYRVLLRCTVSRDEAIVPSLCSIFSAADWHEREVYDLFGILFDGHPNLIRILLPEDADFYPLRKDYMP